jgi:hypothetical protein
MFFIEARSEKHFMLRIQKSHGGFRKLVLLPLTLAPRSGLSVISSVQARLSPPLSAAFVLNSLPAATKIATAIITTLTEKCYTKFCLRDVRDVRGTACYPKRRSISAQGRPPAMPTICRWSSCYLDAIRSSTAEIFLAFAWGDTCPCCCRLQPPCASAATTTTRSLGG